MDPILFDGGLNGGWDIARHVGSRSGIDVVGYRDRGRAGLDMQVMPGKSCALVVDVGDGLDIVTGSDRWMAGGVVTGLSPGPVRIRSRRVDCVEVRLSPVQAYALLGTAVSSATAPHDVWGEPVRRLREQLAEASWDQRFALTEAFVRQRCVYQSAPEVSASWERIVASHGRVRVGELAQMCGWSRKRLWSRFTAQIGVTPKRAAMLARFDRAVGALGAGMAAAEVAARCGYADQAHLHREIVLFAGRTPAALAGEGNISSRREPVDCR
ncbi:helix-turn-helix domain-containing protein [Nocardia suismassiliense]|uniref:Helix-turn-helix domain-containing protein n=1 Tax=Nocardia suismassiliense TaxID=2077092 RepID=A0ABW6R675_9NOCA